jgi:light-regulated signal transduction histidine kinase (bacteriophytochrome)
LKNHGDSLDKTAREYLKEICEGTIKMEKLISSLLELSRVSQGELAPEFVDLSAIAKNVADGLLLAEPGRKVTFRIAEELITKGDQQLLSVVLDNLLSNALKYTSEEEEASIEFGAMKYRGNKAYYVRDNGAGFDMSFAEKLFIPFNRLHSADRFKGHGIGLATVKKIINRHKGEIWAQSKVGGGTTFYFTLNSDVAN